MFSKHAVVLFSLVAFVNAAPVADYKTNQGVGPVNVSDPIKLEPSVTILPNPSKRDTSLNISADLSSDVEVPKRAFVDLDFDGGVSVTLPHLKMRADSSDAPDQQLAGAAGTPNQGEGRNRRGLNPAEARDIVIDSQVFDDGLSITLPHLKRQFDDFDTMGEQFSDAYGGGVSQGGGGMGRLAQDRRGLDVNKPVKARETDDFRGTVGEQLVDDFDSVNQAISQGGGQNGRRSLDVNNPVKARETDDPRDTVVEQLADNFGGLSQAVSQGGGQGGRLAQGRRSLDVNEPVEARDNVIDSQTLAQLQSFVNDTVNLLLAVGKPDAVDAFLSQVNNLKTKAQDGTLGVNDLLNAAKSTILSL